MESRIVLKTGQQEKLYPPTDVSVSQQRRPQLLSAKFENLVHSIFRNETSTLEINVCHFGVMHWQQWQPPVSLSKDKKNKNKRQEHISNLAKHLRKQLFAKKLEHRHLTGHIHH